MASHRAVLYALLAVIAVLAAGCQHLPGSPVRPRGEGPSGASKAEILDVLAANQSAIRTFTAQGRFTFSEGGSEAVTTGTGIISYRAPDSLSIVARRFTYGQLMRMVTDGTWSYLDLNLPKDKREAVWREGELVAGIPLAMSPDRMVREIFHPEAWNALSPDDIRIAEASEPEVASASAGETGTSSDRTVYWLEIGSPSELRRRVKVAGPPWRVIGVELWQGDTMITRTALADYRAFSDDVHFPMYAEIEFLDSDDILTFEITKDPQINEPIDDSTFEIPRDKRSDAPDGLRSERAG